MGFAKDAFYGDKSKRPPRPEFRGKNIPIFLREQARWVAWRFEWTGDKWDKIPLVAEGKCRSRAKTNTPSTWRPFDEAVNAASNAVMEHKSTVDGLGFVFARNPQPSDDDVFGLDIDSCRNPDTAELSELAKEILADFQTYSEVSPSGMGLKLICRGRLPWAKGKKIPIGDGQDLELYEHGRFFTVTGQRVDEAHAEVADCRDALTRLVEKYVPEKTTSSVRRVATSPAGFSDATAGPDQLSDRRVIEYICHKHLDLWNGSTARYGNDESRADQALCNLLAFYCGPNPDRIDDLFRQSGLVRDKWLNRDDYRAMTISKALEDRTDYYTRGSRKYPTVALSAAEAPPVAAAETPEQQPVPETPDPELSPEPAVDQPPPDQPPGESGSAAAGDGDDDPEDAGDPAKDYGESLYRNPAELQRLAVLFIDNQAEFQAELARLRRTGVTQSGLKAAIGPIVKELNRRRKAEDANAGPPPEPFVIKGSYMYARVESEAGSQDFPIANFRAKILAEIELDDGVNETTRQFEVGGVNWMGVPFPTAKIPAEQYETMKWVLPRWGPDAMVYPGSTTRDQVRAAILHFSPTRQKRRVYAHTGWREVDGRWVYLHAGGGIGPDGPVDGVNVNLDELEGYRLPDPPEGDELKTAVRAVFDLLDPNHLAPRRIMVPIVAAVFRAPLGNIDIAIHVQGRTNSWKTEVAAIGAQFFGAGMTARKTPINWACTANYLESVTFTAKDAVMVIDDFNPTGAVDPVALHATADRIFRAVGNAAGRGRLRSDRSRAKAYYPRSMIFSTGEDTPRGHSCVSRTTQLDVRDGDISKAALDRCQQLAADGVYAKAMAAFLMWLAREYPEMRKRLPGERARDRDKFFAAAPLARTASAAGDYLVGMRYLVRFAHDVGAITEHEASAHLKVAEETLRAMLGIQAVSLREQDPVHRFVTALPTMLAGGRVHLANTTGGAPRDTPEAFGWRREDSYGNWKPQGKQIGWLDDNMVYLIPGMAYSEFQQFASTERNPFGMTSETLWKRMKEKELLQKTDTRGGKHRNTYRKMLSGIQQDVLWVRRSDVFGAVCETLESIAEAD